MALPSNTTAPSDPSRQAIAARLIELAEAHGIHPSKTADLPALLAALQSEEPIPIAALAVVADVLFSILSANQPHRSDPESMP